MYDAYIDVEWDPDSQGEVEVSIITDDESISVTLDREQINNLIQSLRQARDETFGPDA